MGSLFLYPFVLAAGALQSVGNSMNAQLNRSLVNPWLASLVSFVLIVAVFSLVLGVFHRPLRWRALGGLLMMAGVTLIALF